MGTFRWSLWLGQFCANAHLPGFGREHAQNQSVKKQRYCQMKLGETFLCFRILVVKWICVLAKAEVSLSFLFYLPLLLFLPCWWLHTSSLCPPTSNLSLTPKLYEGEFCFSSSKNPTLLSIHLPMNINVVYIEWLQTGNQLFFWVRKIRNLKVFYVKFGLWLKIFFLYHSSFP